MIDPNEIYTINISGEALLDLIDLVNGKRNLKFIDAKLAQNEFGNVSFTMAVTYPDGTVFPNGIVIPIHRKLQVSE